MSLQRIGERTPEPHELLRSLRHRRKLSMKALAKRADVGYMTVHRLEHGHPVEVKIDTLGRVLRALEAPKRISREVLVQLAGVA